MSETKELAELEKTYPSMDLAYPIAVSSYDAAARRLDTVDGRLQTIVAFIVTASAAVPAVASQRGVHFSSLWFYLALTFFLLSIGIGTAGRLLGNLRTLSPTNLYQDWLADAPAVFKKDIIHNAAQDFIANKKLVHFKWKCSVWATSLFAVEAVCLMAWVVEAKS